MFKDFIISFFAYLSALLIVEIIKKIFKKIKR